MEHQQLKPHKLKHPKKKKNILPKRKKKMSQYFLQYLVPNLTSLFLQPFVLTILAFIFMLLFKWSSFLPNSNTNKNSPPSPPKLPIIGNLHQLGLQPHRSLQTLAQRYGPLMLLQSLLSHLLMLPKRSWRPKASTFQTGPNQACSINYCTITKMFQWLAMVSTGGRWKAYLCYIFWVT